MKKHVAVKMKTVPESTILRFTRVAVHFLLLQLLPRNNVLRRIVLTMLALFLIALGGMYGIARWYMYTERNTPLTMGVSFIPDYASYLGVDPQQTMDGLINDLHIRNFRLTSYWSDIEPTQGQYDFSQLDWEFAKADAAHAKISLSVGLRQPRWPECHAPTWINISQPESRWQPQLEAYMTAVINRYKNNPALASYQLENEYLLHGFGQCTNFDRQRLIDEYSLLKRLDSNHIIIVSRSNNDLGTPIGQPKPDEYAVSVYKRVWDAAFTHRYLEYPFPAWYYGFLAGVTKITTGKDMIIHELQAEAWAPNGQNIPDTSLTEQSKSIDAQRLRGRFQYGKATGMKTMYFWGSEYWYYRLTVQHDSSLWNVARDEFTS